MNYLENATIRSLFSNAKSYRKKAETLLRLPHPAEIGQAMTTWILQEGHRVQESQSMVNTNHVIARNPQLLIPTQGEAFYNEWPIDRATVAKNYGATAVEQLTTTFQGFKKKALVQGITLTHEILKTLGVEGDTLSITVSWSDQPMIAHVGAILTDGGYSISEQDMQAYEEIVE